MDYESDLDFTPEYQSEGIDDNNESERKNYETEDRDRNYCIICDNYHHCQRNELIYEFGDFYKLTFHQHEKQQYYTNKAQILIFCQDESL